MGLGKTVEVMALILANPAPASVVSGRVLPNGKIASRATLVVCAVSLVGRCMNQRAAMENLTCQGKGDSHVATACAWLPLLIAEPKSLCPCAC